MLRAPMIALWRRRPWPLRVLVLALCASLVGLLQALAPQSLAGVEQAAGDLSWRLGASAAPERRVVVVDIDEASLRAIGPWPWPRSTLARLSRKIEQAGAAVQVFDIVFPEPRDGDTELAQAWAEAPAVAGQIFSLDPAVTPVVGEVAGALGTPGCPDFAPRSYGHIANASGLPQAVQAVGHLSPRVESDGVVRKLPAIVCHEGRAYPTLALAALWRVARSAPGGAPDWTWHHAGEQAFGTGGWGPAAWLSSPSLPTLHVPLDRNGDLRLPYRVDRRALASVSAADLLNGTAPVHLLKGTIALVGATAFGIGDTVATPQAAVASGLEIHALTIVGLLDRRLPYTPVLAPLLQGLALVLVAALLLAAVARTPNAAVKRLPIVGLLLVLACAGAASWALLQHDLWLPWAAVALFALLGAAALGSAEHALTRAQRERVSAHLGAYLPAPVARRLMASDPSGSVQLEEREITVLVADIRNFSAFATHRPAAETAAMLHAFCCIAVDVVEAHGGVVENVVGDSIMAVWNAYAPCADHPQQALRAAQELLRATRLLLAPTVAPQDDNPVQPLALGVGLETGGAIVGSFGPARRRAHAALGEPVSVAARLQQMTSDLSIPILIGPQLATRLPAGDTEPIGDYLLEGLRQHYTLHAPVAWAELVPAEPLWASSASASESRPSSRWGEGTSPGALSALAASTPHSA